MPLPGADDEDDDGEGDGDGDAELLEEAVAGWLDVCVVDPLEEDVVVPEVVVDEPVVVVVAVAWC